MDISALLNDKTIKSKEKTEVLSKSLPDNKISASELTAFAETAKDPLKATCIEALEFATKQNPKIVDKKSFRFVLKTLASKAPIVKWESAKVIGNTAYLRADKLDDLIILPIFT